MMQMPTLIQGNARCLPLADSSVDLIVTSPPYWSLRSYSDHGEHYEGQIGSEPTWQEYLDNLIDCTQEWMRVLKPSGSMWVNLGDRYTTSFYANNVVRKVPQPDGNWCSTGLRGKPNTQPVAHDPGAPPKSLLLLPHRYAIRCADELGLIVRQDQVWEKKNGLPESVVDRTRRSHEYLFHMVKSPCYYSAVDEIRSEYAPGTAARYAKGYSQTSASKVGQTDNGVLRMDGGGTKGTSPLGKLPGSVWSIPSQPLNVPDHISHARCCAGRKRDGCEDGLDHYAAFPMALVRPVILGWSPREVCNACGEGRRPIVAVGESSWQRRKAAGHPARYGHGAPPSSRTFSDAGDRSAGGLGVAAERHIVGQTCACSNTHSSTDPGVVLDPFGGTASAALVAAMNGRTGISIDASWDYSDVIARWRIHDPKERARAAGLDPDAVARIQPVAPTQGSLWDIA